MSLNAKLNSSTTNYTITLNQSAGRLSTAAPVTLRNESISGISSLADLTDVAEVLKVDGSSLVYDAENSRYEIRAQNLDGGSF